MESIEKTKETVRNIFTEYLKEHNLRKTPERFAILDRIYSIDGLFDIDSLLQYMISNNYHVSKATLYNNIMLLLDCKLVIKLQFGEKKALFERCYNSTAHNHFICTVCGKIKEFSDPYIKRAIQNKTSKNFTTSHYSLYIYGICSKCKKK